MAHPKVVLQKQLEAQKAQVEGLAEVKKTLERLERKIDTLWKAVRDGRTN